MKETCESCTTSMESNAPPAIAKRLWHIVRVMYYMLRKGISKSKLMMDLHLLLKRGKIAGKAIGNLMTFHHHHHGGGSGSGGGSSYYSAFTCRSMDPNTSYYNPREVEFSCSNTPAYPFHVTKRKHRNHHHRDLSKFDVATIAKAFEILNSEITDTDVAAASPSPTPFWSFGKSPAVVRQLRITDSPFPIREEEGDVDSHVDMQAEEFIKQFYDQLRLQQRMTGLQSRYSSEPLLGRA